VTQDECALRLRGGESAMASKLKELGQGHLLEGLSEDKKAALLAQAEELNNQLPGGLEGYITSAKKLLQVLPFCCAFEAS